LIFNDLRKEGKFPTPSVPSYNDPSSRIFKVKLKVITSRDAPPRAQGCAGLRLTSGVGQNKNAEMIDLISSMIHTTESNEPVEKTDEQRLGPLALWIDCRLPTMRAAFEELAMKRAK
jgi:hypothetical protein